MNQECWIAVDTATSTGSVAVARGESCHVQTLEGTASNTLMPTLLTLLAEQGLSLDQVTHLACHQGPGGFTGLRVGASAMQGVSWGLQRPLWGACGLEATAEAYRRKHHHEPKHAKVWVVQDARLGEVYWAQFEWLGECWRCYQPPQVSMPDDMIVPNSAEWIGIGSGWAMFPELQKNHAKLLSAVDSSVVSDAGAVLAVAHRWAKSGVAGNIGRIELNYLRNRVAQTVAERVALKVAPV